MGNQPRYRIATPQSLSAGMVLQLTGHVAHYLGAVLRLKPGDRVSLFNAVQGEFSASISVVGKKEIQLAVNERLRPPAPKTGLTVCFAPIRGGRMETIIEKATELGADMLQPVLTQRSVVDKVNLERADAIAREAAEQCERTSWPDIHEPVKLLKLLGDWPEGMPLIYGDESGGGRSITEMLGLSTRSAEAARAGAVGERGGAVAGESFPHAATPPTKKTAWAILTGPEGGFAPEEFAALARVKSAQAVGLGPRILRADTAVITLCAATMMAWGDWHQMPRFQGGE